jgi:ankyrin repeat protein
MWLSFCKRPMTLDELFIAIAIDPQDEKFDEEKGLDSREQILEICGPLIKFEIRTNIVELGHFSVREYITSKFLPSGMDNPDYLCEKEVNIELLRCCLAYLSYLQLGNGAYPSMHHIYSQNQFLGYTVQWHLHAADAEAEPVIRDLIHDFFTSPRWRSSYMAWSRIWQYDRRFADLPRVQNPSALYYAALFGFHTVVETMLDSRAQPAINNEEGALGGALLAAAENGHPQMLKLLLDAKVDVMSQDRYGKTALHRACSGGNTKSVELLLNANIEVSAVDKAGATALHDAASNDRVEVLIILLNAGANVNATDTNGRTALHRAAWSGYAETVRLLLGANVDVTIEDKFQSTAILGASQSGHVEVVKLLKSHATSGDCEMVGSYDAEDDVKRIQTSAQIGLIDDLEALTLEAGEGAATDEPSAPEYSSHMVYFGDYKTKDERPEVHFRLKVFNEISFDPPFASPPVVFVGLKQLNMDGATFASVEASAGYIAAQGFEIYIESWSNAILSSARCAWLAVGADDPAYQCGHKTIDEHAWHDPQSPNFYRISFPRPYPVVPDVVIWLSKFDLSTKGHWRVNAYATGITKTGFNLHIETWGSTLLYSGTAYWFSYPSGKPGILSGSFNTMESLPAPQPDSKGEVTFLREVSFGASQFSCAPRAILAFNMIDVPCEGILHLSASVDSVTKSGMTLNVTILTGNSTLAAAEISYLLLA